MDNKQVEKNVQVRVPDSIGSGVYANIVNINASQNEVVMDFILHIPSQSNAMLSSRVIVSRDTAQQLSDLLEALLRTVNKGKTEEKK